MTTTQPHQKKSNAGTLSYVDGEIVQNGEPPYDMPADMTEAFVRKLLTYPKGHTLFLPAHAACFSSEARSRLLNTCRSMGGDVWQLYRSEAIKWATVTSDTGKWEMQHFFFVYEAELSSPLIDRVGVTDRNIRLVRTPLGWLTFAEFIWRYDENVADHLNSYLDQKRKECSDLCERIQGIITAVTSDLVLAPIVVAGPAGVEKRSCVGLQAVDKRQWPLPKGLAFLDSET
jgi:hypothetical protein